jgi:hypothetical protein
MQLIVRYCFSVLLLSMCAASMAATDLSETFDTIWEMQWQQSGYPLNAYKWDLSKGRKLVYSVSIGASKSSLNYVKEAVEIVAEASGIEFLQAEEKDPKVQIEFVVRKFSDEELRSMSCFAQPFDKNFRIVSAKVTVSEQQSYRCVLHELMHAMGLMGHPMGDTVLTYFGGNRTKLSNLDRFVLKHWNSSSIQPGMNVFRIVKTLNRLWIFENVPMAEQAEAQVLEAQWFAKTIAQMDKFADADADIKDGSAEPPRILYRSGRLSDAGLKTSRLYIQGMLGTAYLEGFGVDKNPARALTLLMRGSQSGMVGAVNALMRGLVAEKFEGQDVKPACTWLRERLLLAKREDLIKSNEKSMSKSCGDSFSPRIAAPLNTP